MVQGGIRVDADVAIVTVVTDGFFSGGLVTLWSYLKHHPGDMHPIVVLYSSSRAPLGGAQREALAQLSPRIRCVDADDPDFWKARDALAARLRTPERLDAAFLVLEAFRMVGPQRVVAIDSDILFLGSCSDLVDTDVDFAAVRAFDSDGRLPRSFFNSGIVTIGPRHLTGTTFTDLLWSTSTTHLDHGVGKADQAVLNAYFGPSRRAYLEPSLNVSKRHFPDSRGPIEDQLDSTPTRILHFVGQKPWQHPTRAGEDRYRQAESLWHRAFAEAFDALPERNRKLLSDSGALPARREA